MAKTKQRLKRGESTAVAAADTGAAFAALPRWAVWCRRLAAAMLGGLVVYVAYFPSDSILVESGDALWFCVLSLALWTLTMATEPHVRLANRSQRNSQSATVTEMLGDGLAIDILAWSLALWMMVAALATCPPGNLREATNEAWLWVAAAAVVSSSRRLLSDRSGRATLLSLLAAVGVGMAIHALHQEWISLPKTRADYQADPDAVLRMAGVDAPRGSARRMVFANRLLDGGPTATFALANSLAAVLIIAVLVPIGLLRTSRSPDRPIWAAAGLGLLALLGASALFATRSRSALVACVVSAVWIGLMASRNKHVSGDRAGTTRSKPVILAALVVGCLGAVIALGLMFFGDDEWMSAAPASLEFRLQYWKSTVAMLVDHPLLGAGPGGFRSSYLHYRLPVANETVADPHNFFFETLAAGGLMAGLLLILLIFSCARVRRSIAENHLSEAAADEEKATRGFAPWIGYGAGVSLGLVWLFALSSGRLPDFEAGMYAVPIAIASGWLIHIQMCRISDSDVRLIGSAILLSTLIHLTVSGGWTVPGVAIVIWIVVGLICPAGNAAFDETDRPGDALTTSGQTAKKTSLVAFCVGVILLICIRFVSVVPVQQAQLALLRAEDAARRGVFARAESESLRAVQADAWGFEAALWRSEILKSRLVGVGDTPALRETWHEALRTAINRAGSNPLVERAAGEQYLHLYQRYGQIADLEAADTLISAALVGNPTDVSLLAQASMLAFEKSDLEKSRSLAAQARRLSRLGGNIVRDLGLQQIYVVEKIGPRASSQPLLRPIKERFRRRLGPADEPVAAPDRNIETAK